MPLFSPRPSAGRPRVFLSKADRKSVNQLQPIERTAATVVAAFSAVATVALVGYSKQGFSGTGVWRLPLGLGLCALLGLIAWRGNRWLAGIGAIGVVYGVPWGKQFLFAAPALAFFVWTNLRLMKQQRALLAERAAEGNYGVDPRVEAEQSRRASRRGDVKATTDASGRALPPPSKRYTPPKANKKK